MKELGALVGMTTIIGVAYYLRLRHRPNEWRRSFTTHDMMERWVKETRPMTEAERITHIEDNTW